MGLSMTPALAAVGVVLVSMCLRSATSRPRCSPQDPMSARVGPIVRGTRRRRRRYESDLPIALEGIARSLRTGASIRQALGEVSASTEGPLHVDLNTVVVELERGRSLPDALSDWAARSRYAGVRLMVAVLQTSLSAGGPSAQLVDKVALTVRDQIQLEREVAALTSQARSSALVIVFAPVGFTAFNAAVDPAAAAFLFTTAAGRICGVVAVTLDLVGWFWMSRLTRVAQW